MTERELLRLHIEAVWGISIPPLDAASIELSPSDALPPWPLYQARLAREQVTIWRPDIAAEQQTDVLQRAQHAGDTFDPALGMSREVVLWHAGATTSMRSSDPGACLLAAEDAALVEAFEAGSVSYFLDPQRAPCYGVIIDGRLVTVAHSSRRTRAACELGINTLTDARQRGYAKTATLAWSTAVREEGLTPIYSAFAWNTASLRLAAVAGYQPVSQSVYGPVAAARE
jgi:hypothetical protein